MAVKLLTNADNITIANGISAWFQQDWTGDYKELGDIEEVNLNYDPTFEEVYSTRFGLPSRRAKLLVRKEATVSFVLRELGPENLKKFLYGGDITAGQSCTVYETAVVEIEGTDSIGPYVDWSDTEDASPTAFVAAYPSDDFNRELEITITTGDPDTLQRVHFTEASYSLAAGDEVTVFYYVTGTGYSKMEIFGATDLKIEGHGIFQIRALDGGVEQIYDFASVSCTPNGDLTAPLEAHQTIPLQWSLQERNGTFGYLYVK